jgi:hypothetical protein
MNHSNLPSKLKGIKNQIFLNNCYDPINGKYVKKVWAHKLTKLKREKRDLIWEYYKYRKRWSVTYRMKESFQKNVREVTLVYFDDPTPHRFTITREHMDIMKAYDRAVNHTLSLKLTIKTPNEQKTGFRWAMVTKDQFNALPLSDKIADDPIKVDTHDDVKTDDTINIPIIESEIESESESLEELDESDDSQEVELSNEPVPELSVPELLVPELPENEQDEDNIKFDDVNDHAAEEAINDDQNDPSDIEDPVPNIDFNNLPDVVRTDDGVTRSIGNMVQDIMQIIQDDYNLKQYKLVNINDHIWLNMTLKAKDGKIIFLKKLRVIKEMTKELLEKGFTLPDGSVVHLYWTEATRNKKKRRNVHKDEPPTDNTKKSKKQRRRVKRDMRAKKGHIHMKIFFKKN